MTRRFGDLAGGTRTAGLWLANTLPVALRDPLSVAFMAPGQAHVRCTGRRASSIGASHRRRIEAIEVWEAVLENAQPILDMVVTVSKLDDAVRPTFLTYAGEVEEGEYFAHMVENRNLVDALVAKAKELGVELRAGAVKGFEVDEASVKVSTCADSYISARLLVGADGASSVIREQAGIATHGWNYDQSAIVTTVT